MSYDHLVTKLGIKILRLMEKSMPDKLVMNEEPRVIRIMMVRLDNITVTLSEKMLSEGKAQALYKKLQEVLAIPED